MGTGRKNIYIMFTVKDFYNTEKEFSQVRPKNNTVAGSNPVHPTRHFRRSEAYLLLACSLFGADLVLLGHSQARSTDDFRLSKSSWIYTFAGSMELHPA